MKYLQNDFDHYNMVSKLLVSVVKPLYDKSVSQLYYQCHITVRKQLNKPLYNKLNRPVFNKFGKSQTRLYTDLFHKIYFKTT